MDRPLFRIEAMQFRAGRRWSGATLRPPVSLTVLTVALSAAVLAIGVWLGTQSYARKATTPGYLAPLHGVVRVLPPRAGVIDAVLVAEGALVQPGEKLVRVRAGTLSPAGGDTDALVRRALLGQREQVAAQLQFETAATGDETSRLRQRLMRLAQETAALEDQLAVQRGRAALAEQQAAVSRDLAARGYVSAVEQRRREDARLAQTQALDNLRQMLAAKQGERVEQEAALRELPDRSAARRAALQAQSAELDVRLAEAEAQRAYLVAAPVAGRVSALQARAGNPADPAQPLLAIVPEGEALQAVLFVPERAIGFVAPGQPVRLALDAFAFQRFGVRTGTVSGISRTPLRPEQIDAPVPPPREPCYQVIVSLNEQSLTAYGRVIPLQADMQVSANIIFDRRSFIQWLLDPILSAGS